MKIFWLGLLMPFILCGGAMGSGPPVSEDTQTCLECHTMVHPGIVADWQRSRHAGITPEEAMKVKGLKQKVSAEKVPEGLSKKVVGCAECHTLNHDQHKDSFEHNGYKVHMVVSPGDCRTCHATEAGQYEQNIMSHAYGNLMHNPLYRDMATQVNGTQFLEHGKTVLTPPDEKTNADSCLFCHGTVVTLEGMRQVETDLGEMRLPILSGWPNNGVGRINPDDTKGSCGACHARHAFSMALARSPSTCAECHKGPDVPAYPVYQVSKHGNIHSALGKGWDYEAVPWRVGKDFSAPTCAGCHVSLLVNGEGEMVASRTHRMNDRLPWRLFGLVYAHAHPKDPDTTIIKNKGGLPLPTELSGEPVSQYLIDKAEGERRLGRLKKICLSCHGSGWVKGHFARLEKTLETSNVMTRTATDILALAWKRGLAKGPGQKDSIFNEGIEKKWVEQWLFYANSTRFATAMAGADYGVFANGRWYLAKNIQDMLDWMELKGEKEK